VCYRALLRLPFGFSVIAPFGDYQKKHMGLDKKGCLFGGISLMIMAAFI